MSTRTITINLLAKLREIGSPRWNNAIQLVDRAAETCEQLGVRGLVVGTMEEDCEPSGYWQNLLEFQNYVHSKNLKFCLFLNLGSAYWNDPTPGVVTKYIDFMLLKTWKYHLDNDQDFPPVWNNAGKILFLTGKPDRRHRAPVIWELYKQQQLENFEWSLFVPPELENRVKKVMPNMTEAEWQEFLTLQRSPDNIIPLINGDSIHYYGFPIGKNVYADTSVSLVSESLFDQPEAHPRATEKLWKAITYQHPFVVLTCPNLLPVLKKLGYHTFDNYLPYPRYNEVEDKELAVDLAIKNILALQRIAEINPDSIRPDVVHNYQVNKSRFGQNVAAISQTLAQFGYQGQVFDVIPTHDLITGGSDKTRFYEEIKQ